MPGCCAQQEEKHMTREAIQLNPDKVKLHIAHSGLHIKALADERMTAKTIHRIKAGKNTTMTTAHKLATKLGTTVDNLIGPVKAGEMHAFLPDHWLYDEVEAPSGADDEDYLPCSMAIGGGNYLVDQSPTGMNSPLEKLLAWRKQSGRKIVLRRENQAFVIEVNCFDYSPDHPKGLVYHRAMACRFFPLTRNGDTFKKTCLSDWPDRYVWDWLKVKALASAEIVSIDGHDYPDDPRDYFPLVRFSRGMLVRRVALGARIFTSQYEFRESLLAYLKDLPAERIQARLSDPGIVMAVNPVRPAVFNPNWSDDELEIKLNLAWRLPDGKLALAPWRDTSREQFVKGIASRNWQDMHMHHLPLRFFSEEGTDEDAEITPFEVDPSLSAEILIAISAHEHPALL
jgi:hypothetical protein